MTTKNIYKELETRVLVMDGAMGSLIQEYKLTEADYHGERLKDFPYDQKGNNDILSLTHPDIIREIHHKYLEAGADIVLTNTFNATPISQADYHTEELVYEMNKASAEIARKAADEFTAKDPSKPTVCGWLAGANQQNTLAVA